ncbi:MAG: Co2+/Mg2+ efflux protein ApaG [Chitinophagales bacterium]|nr:Co2+/Mg2+ efflux protein ApaG [Chitinophagales bacterium]
MTDKSKIYKEITNDISISVSPHYERVESNPAIGKNIFSYHVTITNLGSSNVKLLSRHWHIIDSNTLKRQVEGDGVVGQQPELGPGQTFEYNSWCLLQTPVGKMYGTYTFVNLDTQEQFEVVIPEFKLHADFKLN